MPFTIRHPVWVSILSVAVLAACAAAPSKSLDQAAAQEAALSVEQLTAQADSALQAGHFRDAARLYSRATLASNDEALAEKATRVAYDHQQLSAALTCASRWLVINPTNQDARRLAGFAALKLYRIDEASAHFAALMSSAYISPAVGFVDVLPDLSKVGSAPAVVSLLKRLVEQYPDLAESHFALAQFALQANNRALALEQAVRAQQLSPYWSPAAFLLAQIQLSSGQSDAALATAQAVQERDNSAANRTEYAVLLLAADRESEGLKLLKELEDKESEPAATRALALTDFQYGNYDAAFTRLNRLLTQGKYVYESMFYIANIAERVKTSDQALQQKTTDQALQLYGRVVEGEYALPAQIRIAQLALVNGDLDGGLNSLQEFGESNPDFAVETIEARADLLNEAGDESGALALLDDALNQYPEAVSLRMARAFQLTRMNKYPEALAAMQGLVNDRPEDPLALNALGYTMVDRTRKYKEGYALIERAYTQMPDSGAVLDSMGWAAFKLGRTQEALEYLQRAQGRIIDADLDLHLGDVLWAMKRKQDAQQAWQAGLQHAPDNAQLQQRLKRFK